MDRSVIRQTILNGRAVLGIELGTVRVKAVLIDEDHAPIAMGAFDWKDYPEAYDLKEYIPEIWNGIREAYASLMRDVQDKYSVQLKRLASIGLSSSMLRYLPFDRDGNLFADASLSADSDLDHSARELSQLFHSNVSKQCGIAYLYRAIMNGEEYLKEINYVTTPAGYFHRMLSGEAVIGIGEASKLFPIDAESAGFDQGMVDRIDAVINANGFDWKLCDILPKVLVAGEDAGRLTPDGARLLDPSGILEPGAVMAPPESGESAAMVATNSIARRSGSISADESAYAMVVLEHALDNVYSEIEMTATPDGKPVAVVFHDNCIGDLNAWAGVLNGFAGAIGGIRPMNTIYSALFNAALNAAPDCGGVININRDLKASESGFEAGHPMVVSTADAHLTFENFARSLVYGAIIAIVDGIEILVKKEKCKIDYLLGRGVFFKTKGAAQKLMAAALNTPIIFRKAEYNGESWGAAVLAAYCVRKTREQTLEEYLKAQVFANSEIITEEPDPKDVAGFAQYMEQMNRVLDVNKMPSVSVG